MMRTGQQWARMPRICTYLIGIGRRLTPIGRRSPGLHGNRILGCKCFLDIRSQFRINRLVINGVDVIFRTPLT